MLKSCGKRHLLLWFFLILFIIVFTNVIITIIWMQLGPLLSNDAYFAQMYNYFPGKVTLETILVLTLPYIIPIIYYFIYIAPIIRQIRHPENQENLVLAQKRVLNAPVYVSLTNFIGWTVGMFNSVFWVIKYNLPIGFSFFLEPVIITLFCGGFCFVISYFLSDIIIKNIFIPHFFPGNKISFIKNRRDPSIKTRFFIYFFSVSIYPLFFLLFYFIRIKNSSAIPLEQDRAFRLSLFISTILIAGFVITKLLVKIFQRPLNQMVGAVKKIQDNDFDINVPVTSNDELGILAENMNTMAKQLKESREEIHLYNEHLEELVEQRTRDLVQAEKMASLGSLTAGIAHEIKNPLNFINNFSDISVEMLNELEETLQQTKDSPLENQEMVELLTNLKANLEKIHHHGERADGIVRSMLLHSRGDTGIRIPTSINNWLEEYTNLAYHGMRARDNTFNIEIIKELSPDVGTAEIVPQEMGRAVVNILNNAFQATKEKVMEQGENYRAQCKIATHRQNDNIAIEIWDNGIGIPPEYKAKIFQPFFTTRSTGNGVGLGLSIAYDIVVKEHSGKIDFESQAGEFSKFQLTFPLKIAHQ